MGSLLLRCRRVKLFSSPARAVCAIVIVLVWMAVTGFSADRHPRYRVEIIDPPAFAWVADLNNSGEVVGRAGSKAFLYSRGKLTFLSFDAAESAALGINDLGQIVGWRSDSPTLNPAHPCVYDKGKVIDLDVLTGQPVESAHDINNAGVVAGELFLTNAAGGWVYNQAAFIHPDGTVKTPPIPAGARSLYVFALNNVGQIAGRIEWLLPPPSSTAAIFSETETVVIPLESENYHAQGINDYGAAVGGYFTPFVFQNGVVNLLPQFPGQTSAMPMDINNDGDIVGQAREGWDGYRPFLIREGVLYDLNLVPRKGPEIWPTFPMKINDRGQILGVTFRGTETVGFLLTPIGYGR
jgi:hypothetical protein